MVSHTLKVTLGFGVPPGLMVCQELEVILGLAAFFWNLQRSSGSRTPSGRKTIAAISALETAPLGSIFCAFQTAVPELNHTADHVFLGLFFTVSCAQATSRCGAQHIGQSALCSLKFQQHHSDYTIITVGSDSDENNKDPVIVKEPATELTENTASTGGMLTIQPHFQGGGSNNHQPPPQMSNGVRGLTGVGDQPVSQMNRLANLRRNPDSAGVEFIPLNKKGRSSASMEDNMARNTSGIFDKEKHRNQLLELKYYCEGLQNLIENTNKQVAQLCRIISKMQHTEEEQSLLNKAIPTAEEPSVANTPEMMGDLSMGPDAAASFVRILPNLEIIKAETNQRENTQVMNNVPLLGNNNGQDSPHVIMHSNADSSTEMRSETVICQTSTVENGSGQDTETESFVITPGYALLPLDIFVKAKSMENSNGTMIFSTVSKNDNSHGSSSSSHSIPLHVGYLGNPERNITILKMHLMNAQKKREPKHAARYLARILFSKEVLVCSSVGTNPYLSNLRNRQPLDPNKLAAIREYLATVFPNHDLREGGREWRACLSYISALIRYLCSTVRETRETVTTNSSIPASAYSNDNRDGDGGEGSSQLLQQADLSEARASGNYQPNSSAVPEGVEESSTSDSPVPCGALSYIGNPNRNIKLSHLVLNIAKKKASPEMSARYLISHLFPEEVLLKSNVYGNLWHSICALNYNKINALREFLQDIFPKCDLSENGRDWKLCMQSINCYIHSLRCGHGNSTCESLPPEAMTPSIKSESSDTDYSD
ncbi:BEN domain-containing protein 2 [Pteronotus mesoamericanus]|uniref:BEN domain-containing protein 2 n=1 Tax=Pteronotus mesoamericanus TaxID=1884717 RepID=UPI0023EC5A50|nr:BEN domain-containing protein 2 [Pteronotus parnellii mesoamericanus]